MTTPKLRDVAERAGVHIATASRALNPATRGLVRDETADRVLRAAAALGYVPNPIARSLKTNRSSSIGLVIPDLTNPFFPPVVRGVEDAVLDAGYTVLVVNTDNDVEQEARLVASLRARQVDGYVFATARTRHPLVAEMAAEGVPIVLANRRLDGVRLSEVTTDDTDGVHAALAHLAELGHSRIAYLAGPPWTSTGQIRARAYRSGVRQLGLASDRDLVAACDSFSEEQGERAMAELAGRGVEFTAVLAGNDLIALGCYDFLFAAGLRCPDDVSVVGFNNMRFVDKLRPALTTVAVPQYQIGAETGRLLLTRIAEPDAPPATVQLPLEFVVRESTGPPRARTRAPARRATARAARA